MATGYIISPLDFSVVQSVNVIDYDLPLECYSGESGSVTFEGKSKQDYSQYLFRLNTLDTMWKITESETGDALSTKLSVTDQIGLLDGAFFMTVFNNSSYTATMDRATFRYIVGAAAQLEPVYDKQGSRFLYPFIHFDIPETTGRHEFDSFIESLALTSADYAFYTNASNGTRRYATDIYKLVSFLRDAGIIVSYYVDWRNSSHTHRALFVKLRLAGNYTLATPIYFNDGHSFLLSESYEGDVCSGFIGVPTSAASWEPQTFYNYFLDENMQIVQNKDEQINGFTKIESASSSADALTKATAAFAANQWKHKVEFASDKVFHLNQPVRLMLERGILNTAISKVTIKSKDDRYYYTCGDLPQTAAQHIKANSWSYGSRLPHNPYAGQLAFI